MTITSSLYTVLSADVTLTAITTEIYPESVPQRGNFPAVTFSLQDDEDDPVLDGIGSATLGTFDIDCWSNELIEAESMASAIKTLLIGYYGTFGANTVTNVAKTRELQLEEADTGLRRVSLQFEILYGV